MTIRDVAAHAGVAVGTASKALSGAGKLREETRERVRAAAAELAYAPNAQARSLVAGRTYTVGVISTDSYGRFTLPIIAGLEEALGPEQVAVMLFDARPETLRAHQHLDSLRSRRVDGIVVTGKRTDPVPDVLGPSITVPVIHAYARPAEPGPRAVVPDDTAGGALAAQHLIDRGRTKLACLTGPRRFLAVRDRLTGVRRALRRNGLAARIPVVHAGWDEVAGRESAKTLLDGVRAGRVDGLVCGNDLLARGAIDVLTDAGLSVPGDVAVIGYDNWTIVAEGARPPLSSVDMNLDEIGRTVGRDLLAAIDGAPPTGIHPVAPTLVARASA